MTQKTIPIRAKSRQPSRMRCFGILIIDPEEILLIQLCGKNGRDGVIAALRSGERIKVDEATANALMRHFAPNWNQSP